MRTGLRACLRTLGLSGALALTLAQTGAQAITIEKGLLGLRILQSYQDVLRAFGQPTRIYRKDEVVEFVDALDARGLYTGGIRGFGIDTFIVSDVAKNGKAGVASGGGAGSGGGMAGLPAPGSGSSPGVPGYPGAGGSGAPGDDAGDDTTGDDTGGGLPGYPGSGAPGAPGAGYPGSQGGLPGYPGAGSGMPGGQSNSQQLSDKRTFEESGGFIFVYLYPAKQLAYEFVFNRGNRLEYIIERGKAGGGRTTRGVGLGSSVTELYSMYGWPEKTQQEGRYLKFNYMEKYHVEFAVLNGRVTGIAVTLHEDRQISNIDKGYKPPTGPGNAFGSKGGPGGGGMGGPMGGPMGGGAPGGRPMGGGGGGSS